MSESDDMYPNDSSYFDPFSEPTEQRIARSKEKAQTLEAVSVLEDLLERLDKRIEFYNSVEAVDESVLDEPERFMHWIAANKQTRVNLISEREWMQSLLDTHKPNR